jgi:hypothetical protein
MSMLMGLISALMFSEQISSSDGGSASIDYSLIREAVFFVLGS